jgi:hypothetical protein
MSIDLPIAAESPEAEPNTYPAEPKDTVPQAVVPTGVETSDTTVLITEAEVLFGTAAARGSRRKPRGWIAVLRQIFAASPNESRPTRRTPPPRLDFLEDSRMAREMWRL